MTPAARLSIEHACARLIARYANLNDRGCWHEVAALFTDDGRLARPTAPDDWIVGPDAILQAFLARPIRRTRHLVANVVIDVIDATNAVGTSAMALWLANDTCKVGTFDDRFAMSGGEWRFVERRGSLTFA